MEKLNFLAHGCVVVVLLFRSKKLEAEVEKLRDDNDQLLNTKSVLEVSNQRLNKKLGNFESMKRENSNLQNQIEQLHEQLRREETSRQIIEQQVSVKIM